MVFSDASTHLYMRVCPSLRPSVCLSVGPSVARFFFKPRKLSGNIIKVLEKMRYGSLTANNLQKNCKQPAKYLQKFCNKQSAIKSGKYLSAILSSSFPLDACLFERTCSHTASLFYFSFVYRHIHASLNGFLSIRALSLGRSVPCAFFQTAEFHGKWLK